MSIFGLGTPTLKLINHPANLFSVCVSSTLSKVGEPSI